MNPGDQDLSASVTSTETDVDPADNVASESVSVTGASNQAVIDVVASPSNGGTVAGNGVYAIGSTQVVSAVAATGWQFNGWENGSIQNPRTIVVPAAGATYTAYFSEKPYVPVAGNYNGLFAGSAMSADRVGFFTITTTAKGTYSVKVQI